MLGYVVGVLVGLVVLAVVLLVGLKFFFLVLDVCMALFLDVLGLLGWLFGGRR